MTQVTIAQIDGGCAGAALGWAAACDLRFASTRVRFSTGFINVGASGDMGLVWNLVRVVGSARARELLLFGEKFDAEAALSWGLVSRLFAADRLEMETQAAAIALIAKDDWALRMMKANLISAEELSLRAYIEIESARHLHVMQGGAFNDLSRSYSRPSQETTA